MFFLSNSYKNITVVTFWRQSFSKDQAELNKSLEINLIIIKPYVWATLTKVFYPKNIRGQIKFHLCQDDISKEVKNKAEKFIYPVLKKLNKYKLIDAFIVGNVDYMEHQSWGAASKKLGIPFIIMLCEGYFTQYWHKKFINQEHFLAKTKFIYDKILVPGTSAINLAFEANIAPKNQIIVTGYPRTDVTYSIFNKTKEIENEEKDIILLIAFNEPNYFADRLWRSLLNKFCNLAQENSNYKFVVKTKTPSLTSNLLNQMTENQKEIDNLTVDDSLDVLELTRKLRAVISFTSTYLLEAMCGQTPLIVPVWDDGLESYKSGATFFDLNNNGLHYIYSPGEFLDLMNKICDDHEYDKYTKKLKHIANERKIFLQPFLYKVDGKRTHAVAKTIVELTNNKS